MAASNSDTEKETNQKKFSNWLQSIQSLEDTKTALRDHVVDLWKEKLMSWSKDIRDEIPTFLRCVSDEQVKLKGRKWQCECQHRHCCTILDYLLKMQQNPGTNIVWNSSLCDKIAKKTVETKPEAESQKDYTQNIFRMATAVLIKVLGFVFVPFKYLTTSQEKPGKEVDFGDIFDGCKKGHVWCIANMFMQRGKAKTSIINTGPEDTDASMFFRMMMNCNLFEIESENYLYEEVIECRNKLHHCANNRIPQSEAVTHFDTMTSLLEKFENVPRCTETVSKLKQIRDETILTISVPTIDIRQLAKKVFMLRISSLEVDKETNKSKGFCNDMTNSLIEDTSDNLENIDDHNRPLNEKKSSEDYSRQIQEYKGQVKKLETKNKVLHIQRNRANGEKETVISGKVKDHQKQFENMTSLVNANAHNPAIADALSTITPLLVEIVEAASESDKTLRVQFEEVCEQEMPEQETRTDIIYRRQQDTLKGQDSERPEGRDIDKDSTDSANSARLHEPSATTIVELESDTYRPHLWSVTGKQSYNIKAEQEQDCEVWDCSQLPTGEILLADFSNSRVKKLDTSYQIVRVCDLPYLSDVRYIGNNEAVVYFNNVLQFVDVVSMTLIKSVKIEYKCYGLACHDSKLYVLTADGVYMYRTDGTPQRCLYTIPCGVSMLPWQTNIAVNDEGSKIYITTSGSLITIDSSGNHLFTLSDQELDGACDLCVDGEGHVLVCNIDTGSILQVSHDGKHKLGTIVNTFDIENPEAICFDRHKSTLTCTGLSNNVTVLQLK